MTNDAYCDELTHELPAELRVWLSNATRGLGRIGITRVVEDIGAHYAEAYEEAVTDGIEAERASDEALASLGDPRKAHRGFRKQYLTEYEEGNLVKRYSLITTPYGTKEHVWGVVAYCSMILLICSDIYERIGQASYDQNHSMLPFVSLLLATVVCSLVSNRWLLLRRVRQAISLDFICYFLFAFYLLVPSSLGIVGDTLFICFTLYSFRILQTARKLPTKLSWDEMHILLKGKEIAQ